MRRRTGRKREKFIGDSEQKRKRDAAKKRNRREKGSGKSQSVEWG